MKKTHRVGVTGTERMQFGMAVGRYGTASEEARLGWFAGSIES